MYLHLRLHGVVCEYLNYALMDSEPLEANFREINYHLER